PAWCSPPSAAPPTSPPVTVARPRSATATPRPPRWPTSPPRCSSTWTTTATWSADPPQPPPGPLVGAGPTKGPTMLNLTVNGSPELLEDDDLNLTAAMMEGGDHCAHCGDTIAEYVTGWEHDTTGNRWCHDLTDSEAAEDDDATAAAPAPVAPGNWAGVTIKAAE